MSRIASNLGGVFDAMWGKMMLQGDANALRHQAARKAVCRPGIKVPIERPRFCPFSAKSAVAGSEGSAEVC